MLCVCVVQVSELEGVLEVNDPHFWVLCSGTYVGTLRLEVLPGTDCKRLLKTTRTLLNQVRGKGGIVGRRWHSGEKVA